MTHCKKMKYKYLGIFSCLLVLILLFNTLGIQTRKVQAGATPIDPDQLQFNKYNSLVIAKDVETSAADVQVTGSSPQITRMTGNDRPWNMTDSDATQVSFSSPSEMANSVINVKYAKPVGTYGSSNDSVPIYAQLKIHDIKAQPTPPQYGTDYLSWEFSDKLYNGIQANGEQQFHVDLTFTNASGTPIDVGEGENSTYVTLNSLNQATASATNGSFNHIVTGNEFVSYEKMGSLPYYKINDSILKGYTSPWTDTPVIGGNRDAASVKNTVQTDLGFPDILGYKDFTKASASFQVQGSTLKFVIGNYADSTEDNKANGGAYGYLNGQWTAFSSATLWLPIPQKPQKDVVQNTTDDSTNLANFHSINKQEVHPNEKFEYTVSQKVGVMNVSILNKYNTFEFTDKLPDEVNYLKNGYVTNSDGARLPDDAGSFIYEDGILKYAFSDNYLTNQMPYKGETYTAHFPVQVKNSVKPNITINNIAHTQINKDSADTNKTSNPTGDDTGNKIVKKIFLGKFGSVNDWDGLFKSVDTSDTSQSDTAKSQAAASTKALTKKLTRDGGNYDGSDSLKDEQKMAGKDDTADINFAIKYKLSSYGDFNSVTLMDKLSDAFTYKSAKILTSDGKDITNDGKLNMDSTSHQLTWTANDPASLRGKNIYMYLTVNLNKDYKYSVDMIDSQTGNYVIPNDSSVIVDNNTFTSNQVHVVVPNDSLMPKPVKSVVDGSGNDINHQEVANGDTIYYHVGQKVGTLKQDLLKPYKTFILSDKLDSNLKYLDSYVINKDTGKKINDTNTTEYDAKTRTVSWTASSDFLNNGMALKGETYDLVIKAAVDDSDALDNVTDGSNVDNVNGQVVIKNIGQITVDDNKQSTNEVDNPIHPKDPQKPTKTVVDSNGDDMNHKKVKNGDSLTYPVDQKVGTLGKDLVSRYKSFIITDQLDKDVDYVSAQVINKATKQVISDPSEFTFDSNLNMVSWTASDDTLQKMQLKGETYELVVKAKVNVKDSNKVKDQIKNTATVNIDDNPQLTNEVENPLMPPDTTPTKTVKNSDGKDVDHKDVLDGQTLTFNLSKKVGSLGMGLDHRYNSFSITDKLDPNLKFESAYVQDDKSKEKVSTPSEISFDEDSNTVTFNASSAFLSQMPLNGETYTLVINAKVNVQDSDKNQEVEINNTGTIALDGNSQNTNTTDNHYKPAQPSDPTKMVVNHDGKDINNNVVANGDTLYYHIDRKVGTLNQDLASRYKEFSMTDKLDQNLNYVKAYLVNKDTGKTVSDSSEVNFDKDDNTVTWKASDNFLKEMPLKGETYELVIEAKVDVTSQTSPTDTVIIENTASVSLNNNPRTTNVVDNQLKDQGKAPKPSKHVVDKDGKDINNTTVQTGNTLYYHVDQKVGTLGKDISQRYPKFTIIDTLDSQLNYKDAYVINKSTGKKVSDTSEISFDDSTNTVTFTASSDFLKNMLLEGETYEMVIEVTVGKDSTMGSNGVAKSAGDGTDNSSNNKVTDTANNDNNQVDTKSGSDTDVSDASIQANDIVNVATVNLGNDPQDTNEVRNKLESSPDKKDKGMPEDDPSYKKMAQTGSSTTPVWISKTWNSICHFFKTIF